MKIVASSFDFFFLFFEKKRSWVPYLDNLQLKNAAVSKLHMPNYDDFGAAQSNNHRLSILKFDRYIWNIWMGILKR